MSKALDSPAVQSYAKLDYGFMEVVCDSVWAFLLLK